MSLNTCGATLPKEVESEVEKENQRCGESENDNDGEEQLTELEENEYVPANILAEMRGDDGRPRYLINWEDYPLAAATWEPIENLQNVRGWIIPEWEQLKSRQRLYPELKLNLRESQPKFDKWGRTPLSEQFNIVEAQKKKREALEKPFSQQRAKADEIRRKTLPIIFRESGEPYLVRLAPHLYLDAPEDASDDEATEDAGMLPDSSSATLKREYPRPKVESNSDDDSESDGRGGRRGKKAKTNSSASRAKTRPVPAVGVTGYQGTANRQMRPPPPVPVSLRRPSATKMKPSKLTATRTKPSMTKKLSEGARARSTGQPSNAANGAPIFAKSKSMENKIQKAGRGLSDRAPAMPSKLRNLGTGEMYRIPKRTKAKPSSSDSVAASPSQGTPSVDDFPSPSPLQASSPYPAVGDEWSVPLAPVGPSPAAAVDAWDSAFVQAASDTGNQAPGCGPPSDSSIMQAFANCSVFLPAQSHPLMGPPAPRRPSSVALHDKANFLDLKKPAKQLPKQPVQQPIRGSPSPFLQHSAQQTFRRSSSQSLLQPAKKSNLVDLANRLKKNITVTFASGTDFEAKAALQDKNDKSGDELKKAAQRPSTDHSFKDEDAIDEDEGNRGYDDDQSLSASIPNNGIDMSRTHASNNGPPRPKVRYQEFMRQKTLAKASMPPPPPLPQPLGVLDMDILVFMNRTGTRRTAAEHYFENSGGHLSLALRLFFINSQEGKPIPYNTRDASLGSTSGASVTIFPESATNNATTPETQPLQDSSARSVQSSVADEVTIDAPQPASFENSAPSDNGPPAPASSSMRPPPTPHIPFPPYNDGSNSAPYVDAPLASTPAPVSTPVTPSSPVQAQATSDGPAPAPTPTPATEVILAPALAPAATNPFIIPDDDWDI